MRAAPAHRAGAALASAAVLDLVSAGTGFAAGR